MVRPGILAYCVRMFHIRFLAGLGLESRSRRRSLASVEGSIPTVLLSTQI
jgi:hypothetical protein